MCNENVRTIVRTTGVGGGETKKRDRIPNPRSVRHTNDLLGMRHRPPPPPPPNVIKIVIIMIRIKKKSISNETKRTKINPRRRHYNVVRLSVIFVIIFQIADPRKNEGKYAHLHRAFCDIVEIRLPEKMIRKSRIPNPPILFGTESAS